MKKLSKRLESLISVIQECNTIADIGTDHAWLPIELIRRGIASKVYAIDNKTGPLNKARDNIETAGVSEKIRCILSDGLSAFQEEVDAVIIAGVGVQTIISILENAHNLKDYKRLVLQPNYGMPLLRKWLSDHDWGIIKEKILFERGTYYEIIVAVQKTQSLDEDEIEFGPILMHEKSKVFCDKYNDEIRAIQDLIPSISDYNKREELNKKVDKIKKVLQ
ncbi:MAG: class I SAM-dependent methyltransferase [Bacilli bacterium]|jgi:tRNA (adenine22-N1)-methyltransferase